MSLHKLKINSTNYIITTSLHLAALCSTYLVGFFQTKAFPILKCPMKSVFKILPIPHQLWKLFLAPNIWAEMQEFSWIPLLGSIPLFGPCCKFPKFTSSKQDSLTSLLFPLQFCQLPGFWKPASWKASCHHVAPVPLWVVQKLRVRGLHLDVLNFSCSILEEMILEKNQPNTPPVKI